MDKYYPDYYGRSVVLIGRAQKGQFFEPVLVDNIEAALDFFESGELIEAAREVLDAGAKYVYLVRVNGESKHDLYYDLKEIYEILETMGDIDIILPLNIGLTDYIIEYPDIFRTNQEFAFNGDNIFVTDRLIQSINYIKVNDKKTDMYALRSHSSGAFDGFILDKEMFDLNYGDKILINYNTLKTIEIEFEIMAFKENKIVESITLTSLIDTKTKINSATNKMAKDFFALTGNVKYIVRCLSPFVKAFTDKTGNGLVYAEFDYDKYIADNTNYKYFVSVLAKACTRINAIGLLEPKEKTYNKLIESSLKIKEILNDVIDYGKYIVAVASVCHYGTGINEYSSHYITSFAGLLGTLFTRTSPTYCKTPNVISVEDEFTAFQVQELTKYGYVVLYNSVRNGIVPYQAVTMAQDNSPFFSLKNIRIVNEVSTRIKEITDTFIGRSTVNIEIKLSKLLTELFQGLGQEEKIKNYKFEFSDIRNDYIKINFELQLYDEVNTIKDGVISSL